MKMLALSPKGRGIITLSEKPLGRGGEGSVYKVESISGFDLGKTADMLVGKVYHDSVLEKERASVEAGLRREKKIIAMLSADPNSEYMAWPMAALYTESKKFAGYVMMKLDSDQFRPWYEMANVRDRRSVAPDFDVAYAMTAARNFLVAVEQTNGVGHCLGDINESNIFISSTAGVMVVDTDSAQIKEAATGKTFPCAVGKMEYTAPELTHGALVDNPRTPASDLFASAIAVFQLLIGGAHPSDGVYHGPGDAPTTVERIRSGQYPALDSSTSRDFSPAERIATRGIPRVIVAKLREMLSTTPQMRPGIGEVIDQFDAVIARLKKCDRVKRHWYDPVDGSCGWCQHADEGKADPWGEKRSVAQVANTSAPGRSALAMPSTSFNSAQNVVPQVTRVPMNTQATQAPPASYVGNGPGSSSPSSRQHQLGQRPGGYGYVAQNLGLGGSGSSGTGAAPSAAPVNNTPPPPRIPSFATPADKDKHGNVILSLADGTEISRPSYKTLIQNKPSLAWYAFREEFPAVLRAWWGTGRGTPKAWALALGALLGMAESVAIFMGLTPLLLSIPWVSTHIPHMLVLIVCLLGGMTGAACTIWLFISGLWFKRKIGKYGKGELVDDKPVKTILRFVPIPLVWGPIMVIFGGIGLVLVIIAFLAKEVKYGK